jgi:hypothetical protein
VAAARFVEGVWGCRVADSNQQRGVCVVAQEYFKYMWALTGLEHPPHHLAAEVHSSFTENDLGHDTFCFYRHCQHLSWLAWLSCSCCCCTAGLAAASS